MNVYCITFPNKKRYVGVESVTGRRKAGHRRSKGKQIVSRQIRKHGWENCTFEYILMNESSEICYKKEMELIKDWKLQDYRFGYNMSSGGEFGRTGSGVSLETRQKISAGLKKTEIKTNSLNNLKLGRGLIKSKPIKCLNNEKTYESLVSAAKELGLIPGSISNQLAGRTPAIHGYKFIFV